MDSPKRYYRFGRAAGAVVATLSLVFLTSGCADLFLSAEDDQSAVSVLPATDVVIETNLQSAATGLGSATATTPNTAGGGVTLPAGIGGGGEAGAISSIENGQNGSTTAPTTPAAPAPVEGAGGQVTAGPSTGVGVISEAGSGGVAAYVGFNKLSRDCLGIVVIPTGGTTTPVLGETSAGMYRFWVLGTTSSNCQASHYLATNAVPSGWPKGDPSASGFPLP